MWTIRLLTVAAATVLLVAIAAPGREEVGRFSLHLVATDETGSGDATISPDGRRFVTASRRTGDRELWIYELDTRRWSQVTHQRGEDFEAKWSPDASRLVFTSARDGQKDIWIADLKSGEQRRLTFSPDDDEYPGWSPDGRTIVYTGGPWNARDFLLIPAAGGEPRKISRVSGRAGACAFESAGDTLICHRYDSGTGDLQRVWIRDGEVAPLTSGSGWDYKGATAPDGKLIAFSRSVEGPSRIWLMPAAGGRAWPITGADADDRWPTWSQDSRHLLFHRAAERSLGVERLDLAGTGPPATLIPAEERPLQASLAPDGKRLAYCAATPRGRRVQIRQLDTDRTDPLETGGREACFPRWSPDGRQLAFVIRDGDRWEVAVAAPTGGGLRMLTAGHGDLRGMDGPIDWSPDGRRLVFHADTAPFEARLYTADLASGAIAPLTSTGAFDEAPSWSAADRILFMSTRGGNWTWSLFTLQPSTGKMSPFVAADWTEKNFPREDRRGRRVWTQTDDRGRVRLMWQDSGGAPRVVNRSEPGVRWPEFVRDGSAVIYTRLSQRVEYWMVDNPAGAGAPTGTMAPPARPADAAGFEGKSPRSFNRR